MAKRVSNKTCSQEFVEACEPKAPTNIFNKLCAFTLAEVLITLAIIGVVAALTIPTVVKNYQKQQTVVRLKKAYSELYHAVTLSQIENGAVKTWDLNYTYSKDNGRMLFEKYLKPYLKIASTCPDGYVFSNPSIPMKPCGKGAGASAVNYLLANGSSISLSNSSKRFAILVDINAQNGPNELGKDCFTFILTNADGLYPYNYPTFTNATREDIINDGTYGCTKEAITYPRHNCVTLIMFDNWEIKDDYPW